MAAELMFIPNDNTQNFPFNRLKLLAEAFELNDPTNQNSLKSPNLLSQQIRNKYKTLGTSVINSHLGILIIYKNNTFLVIIISTIQIF